jgi:hypothetical protein
MRFFILFFLAMTPLSAHAYLDPGTGSLIIQGIIAALVPVVAFWRSIKMFLIRLFKREKSDKS